MREVIVHIYVCNACMYVLLFFLRCFAVFVESVTFVMVSGGEGRVPVCVNVEMSGGFCCDVYTVPGADLVGLLVQLL